MLYFAVGAAVLVVVLLAAVAVARDEPPCRSVMISERAIDPVSGLGYRHDGTVVIAEWFESQCFKRDGGVARAEATVNSGWAAILDPAAGNVIIAREWPTLQHEYSVIEVDGHLDVYRAPLHYGWVEERRLDLAAWREFLQDRLRNMEASESVFRRDAVRVGGMHFDHTYCLG